MLHPHPQHMLQRRVDIRQCGSRLGWLLAARPASKHTVAVDCLFLAIDHLESRALRGMPDDDESALCTGLWPGLGRARDLVYGSGVGFGAKVGTILRIAAAGTFRLE